jgi:hypothetical protein
MADKLSVLCAELQATGAACTPAARHILDLAWEWIGKDIGSGLALSPPSYRTEKLGGLGRPLASVLTAAAAIGAADTRDTVSGFIRRSGDAVTVLEMSALRAAAELPEDDARGDAGFGDLAADCAARLRTRLALPQHASGDWSIGLPAGGCTCNLCDTLRVFLENNSRRTFEWPLAQAGQAPRALPDRRRRTARHTSDQAARPPVHARPEEDRGAVRQGAGGADQGRNGSGVAGGTVESPHLINETPNGGQRATGLARR